MPQQEVTVIFVHGVLNKPAVNDLKRIWEDALGQDLPGNKGFNLSSLGISTKYVYWADLYYKKPLEADQYESVDELLELNEAGMIDSLNKESDWAKKIAAKYQIDIESGSEIGEDEIIGDEGYERIPLPYWLKKRFMSSYLGQVYDFLFNTNEVKSKIHSKIEAIVATIPSTHKIVFVGHSQGTVIAYDFIKSNKSCPPISGLLTIGSPLGLDEIQDELEHDRETGFPGKIEGDWKNVYDSYDLISRPDPILSNDFKKNGKEVIEDIREQNYGYWRHSATKYFKGKLLRSALRQLTGRD